MRASFNLAEDAAPNGSDWSRDFNLDNLRLYLSGQGNEYLGFEFNTDINNAQFLDVGATPFEDGGDVRVLDAVVKIAFADWANLWFGRFLPPSDRSNLDGPFYLNVWEFPFVQFGYPNIFQGRDDGAALWGQLGEGQFKWQVGAFEGTEGLPNSDEHLMFTARLVWNLLDPEPGYYNQSTYYGEKQILAIGAAVMHQQDAVGTIAAPRDFTGWNVDVLFELPLSNDAVVSVEGAYYDFDDAGATVIEAAPGIFTALSRQGQSYFVLASYLIPTTIYLGNIQGRLQPHVRYQQYDRDFPAAGAAEAQVDIGMNYIIDGHNARLVAVYQRRDPGLGQSDIDIVRLGAQFQF